jgi:hypothetical protein
MRDYSNILEGCNLGIFLGRLYGLDFGRVYYEKNRLFGQNDICLKP